MHVICLERDAYGQVWVLKGIDHFLEEAVEGVALPRAFSEVNVCILTSHPAGFRPQVTIGTVKARHHIVQQQALQLVLVRRLQRQKWPLSMCCMYSRIMQHLVPGDHQGP